MNLTDTLRDELQQGANAREVVATLRNLFRLDDLQAWKDNRIELSAQEEAGDADPDDWAASDDEAASLLAFILDQLS